MMSKQELEIVEQFKFACIIAKVAGVDLTNIPGDSFAKKLEYIFKHVQQGLAKLDTESLFEFFKKIVTDPDSTLSLKLQQKYIENAEKMKNKAELLKYIYNIYLRGAGLGMVSSLATEIIKESKSS